MTNQVTIKKSGDIKDGTFKASVFNENGTPVLNGWQEFDINENMVWDPAKYGAEVTKFYIAKGIGPDADNPNVAYAVEIDFNTATEDAVVTLGIDQVESCNGKDSCCYVFTAKGDNVVVNIIKSGDPVEGASLPQRCLTS